MERIYNLRSKPVIDTCSGVCIGTVCDLEIDVECGRVTAIVVEPCCKGFSLFSKNNEIVICWQDIDVIGEDAILINHRKFPALK
ncbi:MAG: YlmC/YmxH family sporulation protein [Clostridia bacterium]|nr:YlmC/YmxH family sporulation protein [Clostridia bacterium]